MSILLVMTRQERKETARYIEEIQSTHEMKHFSCRVLQKHFFPHNTQKSTVGCAQ